MKLSCLVFRLTGLYCLRLKTSNMLVDKNRIQEIHQEHTLFRASLYSSFRPKVNIKVVLGSL